MSDGTGIATPRGRLTPLFELTSPPTTTRQRARPSLDRSTVEADQAVVDQHVVARARAPRRSRPGRRRDRPRRALAVAGEVRPSSPVASRRGARRGRRRGASAPAGRRSAPAAGRAPPAPARAIAARAACSSCVPCEKLSRTASMPASASARSISCEPEPGPIVATIFVRLNVPSTAPQPSLAPRRALSGGTRGKAVQAGVAGARAELLLDPQQLVVLGDPVRARRRARLDLAGVRRDREVGDRRVLGLAGAVRDHGACSRRPGRSRSPRASRSACRSGSP